MSHRRVHCVPRDGGHDAGDDPQGRRYRCRGAVGYYAGLAEDQLRRDGLSRGPIDYYLDPSEPPGRWWGGGSPAIELSGDVTPERLEAMLRGAIPAMGGSWDEASGLSLDPPFLTV